MPLSNYRLELVRWLPWLKKIFPGAPTLCFGILSSYTLFTLAPKVLERIEEMEFPFVWKTLFCFTVFFRVSERILASIFVAFVLPISQKWADQLDTDREEIFLDLFPWKVFLFLHRILLLTTFFGKPWYLFDFFDDGVHLISLTFRIFVMVWLLVLVLYVGYRPAVLPSQQETQFRSVISTQEVNRKNERVIGHLPLQKVSYPSGSELVTGVTQDFFPLKRCPPDSGPDASSSDALVAHCCYKLAYRELQ